MRFIIFLLLNIVASASFAANKSELVARINFIQNALDKSASHSKLWQSGWQNTMAFNTSLSAFCYFYCDHKAQKFDAVIQVVLGANSTLEAYRKPLKTYEFARELHNIKATNINELQLKLARAEAMLAHAASRERYERSFTSRGKSYLANVVASLLIAYDGRPRDAWQTFALMSLAIELKTRSMPQTMTAAESAYNQGKFLADNRENNFLAARLSIGTRTGRDIQINLSF